MMIAIAVEFGDEPMLSLGLMLALFFIGLLFTALQMWWTARLVKAGTRTYLRALIAAFVVWLASVVVAAAYGMVVPDLPITSIGLAIALAVSTLLFLVFVAIFLIQAVMRASKKQALLILLANVVSNCLLFAAGVFLIKPFVIEGFFVSWHSMAPTMKAWHWDAVCPNCGATMYQPVSEPGQPALGSLPGICGACFQVKTPDATKVFVDRHPPDRFLVNRLLRPQRWDIVVFQDPDDPSVRRVFRLVGLPGEIVYLKDGAVWINGARLAIPGPLVGLRYETSYGRFPITLGTEKRPLILAESECCVLGDFSLYARDSRLIGPIPWKNLEGVVDLIYWPPRSFRILR